MSNLSLARITSLATFALLANAAAQTYTGTYSGTQWQELRRAGESVTSGYQSIAGPDISYPINVQFDARATGAGTVRITYPSTAALTDAANGTLGSDLTVNVAIDVTFKGMMRYYHAPKVGVHLDTQQGLCIIATPDAEITQSELKLSATGRCQNASASRLNGGATARFVAQIQVWKLYASTFYPVNTGDFIYWLGSDYTLGSAGCSSESFLSAPGQKIRAAAMPCDSIALDKDSLAPVERSIVAKGRTITFSASYKYRLETRDQAGVRLRISPKWTSPLPPSFGPSSPVTKGLTITGASSVQVTIPVDAETVEVTAEMYDGDTTLAQTQPVIYPAGDDFVNIDKITPKAYVDDDPSTYLAPGSKQDFEADVSYKLAYSSRGRLLLRAFDDRGRLLATSEGVDIDRSSSTRTGRLSIKDALIDVKAGGFVLVKAVILTADGARVLCESARSEYLVAYQPAGINRVTLEQYAGGFIYGPSESLRWEAVGSKAVIRPKQVGMMRLRIEYDAFDPSSRLSLVIVEKPHDRGGRAPADRTLFVPGPGILTMGKAQTAFIYLRDYQPGQDLDSALLATRLTQVSDVFDGQAVTLEFEWMNVARSRDSRYESLYHPQDLYVDWFSFDVRYRFAEKSKCTYSAEGSVVYSRGRKIIAPDSTQATVSTDVAGSASPSFMFAFNAFADLELRKYPAVSFTVRFTATCDHTTMTAERTDTYPVRIRGSFRSGSAGEGAALTWTNLLSSFDQNVDSEKRPIDARALSSRTRSSKSGNQAQALSLSDMITAGSVWTLTTDSPPAQFSADLTLLYDASDIPDDPNFDESKLQIVAFDPATGAVRAYDTAVDVANKAAMAHVSEFSPFFTLAVSKAPAPALHLAPLRTATHRAAIALANPAADSAMLALTAYDSDGTPLPADTTANPVDRRLSPGQAFTTTPEQIFAADLYPGAYAAMRARGGTAIAAASLSNSSSSAGIKVWDAPLAALVFPDAAVHGASRLELRLTNTSCFTAGVSLELRGAGGALTSTAELTLGPRAQIVSDLSAIFPEMPDTFTGYLTANSTRHVLATLLKGAPDSLTAAAGQPAAGTAKLWLPYFAAGPSAHPVRVTLVNTSDAAATLTITGAGKTASVPLPAGAQLQFEPGQLLGVPPDQAVTGSLIIDAAGGALIGEALYGDPSRTDTAVAPLESAPSRSYVVPLSLAAGATSVRLAIQNTGAAAARIALSAVTPNGAASQPRVIDVPSGTQVVDEVRTLIPALSIDAAYLTLSSDQRVAVLAQASDSARLMTIPVVVVDLAPPAPGTKPSVEVNPSSLDFGAVTAGQTKSLSFTLRNTGSADLTITAMTVDPNVFRLASLALPLRLAPQAQQSVTVTFGPTAAGSFSGRLAISSNDPDRPALTVNLSGAASAAVPPSIGASPNPFDFGTVKVGDTKTLPLTLSNAGGSDLTVTALRVDSIPCAVDAPAVPFRIAPQASQVLNLTFTPTKTGPMIGLLTLVSSDPKQPSFYVNLTGTGTSGAGTPIISLSPAPTLAFGSVAAGQTKEMQLLIANLGSGPLVISSISTGNTAFTMPGFQPFSIDANTVKLITIRFAPGSPGTYSTTLTIASNDPATPSARINLTGTAP